MNLSFFIVVTIIFKTAISKPFRNYFEEICIKFLQNKGKICNRKRFMHFKCHFSTIIFVIFVPEFFLRLHVFINLKQITQILIQIRLPRFLIYYNNASACNPRVIRLITSKTFIIMINLLIFKQTMTSISKIVLKESFSTLDILITY